MKKRMKFFGIGAVVFILITMSFTAAGAIGDENNVNVAAQGIAAPVVITTTMYRFIYKEEISTEVTEEEALEIRDYLEKLHVALVAGDEDSIVKYESILSEKGILGENHEIFSKKSIFGLLSERFSSSTDIENTFCIVNADGHGNLTFFSEAILEYLMIVGAVMLLIGIILLPLLPFALILLLGSVVAMPVARLATHLVPFRVFNSWIGMNLVDGNCSIQGRNGSQDLTAPLNVILRGFAGITINFPIEENPYLFLSGFSWYTRTIEEE